MPADAGQIVRKPHRLAKDRAKQLLAAGLLRGVTLHGKDEIALAAGCSSRCIEKALSLDTLPSMETMLNALSLEPTLLDELLAAYGMRLAPLHAEAANDLVVASGVIDAMGELVRAAADGRRDHTETLAVAALMRPHLPAIQAIVREADALRGVA